MRKTITLCALLGLAWIAADKVSAQDDKKVDFAKDIWPAINESCVKCHKPPYKDERGRTRRPKADMIFTNKKGLLEAKDEEENLIIVPGKPDDSRMLQVTLLPIEDEYHFPPEGKAPEWSDETKKLFAKWIEQGADFGDWERDEETDVWMEEEK